MFHRIESRRICSVLVCKGRIKSIFDKREDRPSRELGDRRDGVEHAGIGELWVDIKDKRSFQHSKQVYMS